MPVAYVKDLAFVSLLLTPTTLVLVALKSSLDLFANYKLMETLNQWITAQSHLKEAAASFLDACLALRKAAAQSFPSHPDHLILENMLDGVRSRISSIGVVENCMHESRAMLNALLNVSTSRVPINRLPPEILGRIFSIAVASSPCAPEHGKRDSLLDIPL
ncbi:hypothetical protein FRC12_004937, partial [Ceratobasidium sp. 428]